MLECNSECFLAVHFLHELHIVPKASGHYPTKKIILVRNGDLGRFPPHDLSGDTLKLGLSYLHRHYLKRMPVHFNVGVLLKILIINML